MITVVAVLPNMICGYWPRLTKAMYLQKYDVGTLAQLVFLLRSLICFKLITRFVQKGGKYSTCTAAVKHLQIFNALQYLLWCSFLSTKTSNFTCLRFLLEKSSVIECANVVKVDISLGQRRFGLVFHLLCIDDTIFRIPKARMLILAVTKASRSLVMVLLLFLIASFITAVFGVTFFDVRFR